MTSPGWHVDDVAAGRYVSGEAGPVECHSIETHFMSCDRCRSLVSAVGAGRVSPEAQAIRWDRLADAIDRPTGFARVVPDVVRLTWASATLAWATVAVTVALVGLAGLAASVGSRGAFAAMLLVSPVAPVALVIAAFRPVLDPAGSMVEATPLAGGRLPFVRSLICSGLALLLGLAAGAVGSLEPSLLVAWFVPALALTMVVIAGSTWVDPFHIAIGLTTVWWISIGSWVGTTLRLPIGEALESLTWTHHNAQVLAFAVAVAAGVVAWVRRDARPDWRAG